MHAIMQLINNIFSQFKAVKQAKLDQKIGRQISQEVQWCLEEGMVEVSKPPNKPSPSPWIGEKHSYCI